MKVKFGDQAVDLTRFFGIGLLWGVIAIGVCARFQPTGPSDGLLFGALFFGIAFANLIFMVKLIEVVANLMSDRATEKRVLYQLQAFLWGNLKLMSFGGLFFLIWKFKGQMVLPALIAGVGTFIVVPLLGGLWWIRKEYR